MNMFRRCAAALLFAVPTGISVAAFAQPWRNTSVRRTTGTAPDEMMSASTWPGPTGRCRQRSNARFRRQLVIGGSMKRIAKYPLTQPMQRAILGFLG
jgi:hypothetical protein